MNRYRVVASIEVELYAFTEQDAVDVVQDALADLDALGTAVTRVDVDEVEDLGLG